MLNIFAEIRRSERVATYSSFFVLFGIMSGHALMETARDALFLASQPPVRLAWVYLAIAFASLLTFTWQQWRGLRPGRKTLSIWLVVSALVTAALWILLGIAGRWVLYVLYIWTGVFATLIMVRFWTLAGDLFTAPQAKRLFALIGAGSVLGAIFGASLARILSASGEPRHMLLVAVGLLLLTALWPVRKLPQPDTSAPAPVTLPSSAMRAADLLRPVQMAWEKPYLRRVGGIVMLSTVAFTLVDFLFKNAVAQSVPAERLGSFFATTYLALNVLSLAAQLFLVSWLVRRFGLHHVLSALPMLFMLGTVGVVAGGGLAAACLLKSFDGALRHSLHRTATEVLYVPLTGELRSRVKGFIDVMGQRGGQALASLCILLAVSIGRVEIILGLAVLLLAFAWIRVARTLQPHYLNLFRENLSKVARRGRLEFPEMDLASLETLMTSLNSANDAEVVAAVDILAERERVHLIPALILYHPSRQVVLRALELFVNASRTDAVAMIDRLLEHPDPEIRAGALRTRAWLAAPRADLYQKMVADPSPIVRATALIGQVGYGGASMVEARASLHWLSKTGTLEEKLALARAVRYMPGAAYEDVLLELADCEELDVRRAVALAMGEIRSTHFIPKLLQMLRLRDLRGEARAALVAIGSEALRALDDELGNEAVDRNIRRQIPRVISSFEPAAAATILMRHLRQVDDGGVRYRILRALSRLRAADPNLPLDATTLRQALESTLRNVFELMDWRLRVVRGAVEDPRRATEVQQLIVALLRHKEVLAMERLFRLIGLLHSGQEDVRSLYRGVHSTSRSVRASSQELLEHLLRAPLRDPMLALVDDIGEAEKLARAGPFHTPHALEYPALLGNLLDQGGVGMRCLVAYHVGELRLHSLRAKLEMLPSDLGGLVSRTVDRTLAVLNSAPEGGEVLDGG